MQIEHSYDVPLGARQISVCVPARNEEARLPALLDALAKQHINAANITVCIFLDHCCDDSAAVIHEAKDWFPCPLIAGSSSAGLDDSSEPNAGRARRAAMSMGLERHGQDSEQFLLTTDADSEPDAGWIAASINALSIADVATGPVLRREEHNLQTRVERYFDRIHRYRRMVDPVHWDTPRGRHFTGAVSFAVRANVYEALGGFEGRASGEDADFLDRASRAGYRVRRDPQMIVTTSSRRHGRVIGGLASTLETLDREGLPFVAHPAGAAWQYRMHARARSVFPTLNSSSDDCQWLGRALGKSPEDILTTARGSPNNEAFAMRVVPGAPESEQLVPLAEAEAALTSLELALPCPK